MGRTTTPPQPLTDGRKGQRLTVQRCCNGCGRELGDATAAEIEAAIGYGPLPDVRDECGCVASVERGALFDRLVNWRLWPAPLPRRPIAHRAKRHA